MTVASPCTQNLMDSAHPQAVLSKLNEQRSQGLFCDVTIVVEDVKFRAHKNILAACSGYFRSALTAPETWSAGQVVELMDLKSEVFASILNFMYCSKETPMGDTTGIAAAGKKLGIPFLEKLAEQEKQNNSVETSSVQGSKKAKKEASRSDEMDTSRGPRITNAFSITEVCPGNNPFTPLVPASGKRQSPDVGELPLSCPTTSCLTGNSETTHALSEHSYAVSNSMESKDSSQSENKKVCKAVMSPPKQLLYKNTGPLKKRHRLRGILGRTFPPTPAEGETVKPNKVTPSLTDAVPVLEPAAATTPPPVSSEGEGDKCEIPQGSTNSGPMELGPPNLSSHSEESISVYDCQLCPEIFSNKALLTIHSQVHKKRFVSHLFCKFCHKKFIHLKRLRNHEQVCLKAETKPSKAESPEIPVNEGDVHFDEESNTESPPNLSTPHTPEPLDVDQPEPPQDVKVIRPGVGQRRYNCSVCKRVYVTISSLKRHENVHSWQRAYPCHYCNKVFALAEYRTKHEIWHTGERRYQCIFCLETFMTYYILKNHQKSFHGIDPNLSVNKKSANGGLKASVYPIKLYRLLPMKFRKRQYKSYSQTYSEGSEGGDPAAAESSTLIPPLEENGVIGHSDPVTFPLTFMATTKTVAPVIPRIIFDKPCDQGIDQSLNSELESEKGTRKEAENRDSTFINNNSVLSLQRDKEAGKDDPPLLLNSDYISNNVPFLKSLSAVKKLGELSASAKRVEDMTKELLQSRTEELDKPKRSKTETYIAKPACPGPSADGHAMPLCQITVKIGNEAIIRRQIKGSKLFPRKKIRIRDRSEREESPSQHPPTRDVSDIPKIRLKPDATTAEQEVYEDPNDCDTGDVLWRPYYSYKAKKKRKRLRLKHRKALFHHLPETFVDRAIAPAEVHHERSNWVVERNVSGGGAGAKPGLSRNLSPRANYNCDICDSSFITETGLRAHVIGSHPCFCRTCGKQGPPGEVPAGGDYICNSCMESGSCFDNTPRSPNPEKKYRCSFCPQRFLYLATKRSHEKKHKETNEGSYDSFTASSKYLRDDYEQDAIKTDDSQKAPDIKSEKEDEFSPKTEDTTDFMSYSSIKRPLSPCGDPFMSSKVKPGLAKKSSMHPVPAKQVCMRDSNSSNDSVMGPRTNSHSEKSCKWFRKNDPDSKVTKWVCKEEPFF